MENFQNKYKLFLDDFGKGRKMVLSTSENNIVSSRMMSVVQHDGIFYFQTDIELKKYRQISANPNTALCIDNIQIEGVCKEIGRPLENQMFCDLFQECFKGSFDAYSSLKNERLFEIRPTLIERWTYIDGLPFIETFNISAQKYELCRYVGI